MKQTKPKQTPPRMEVINKPKVAYTKKSLQFFFRDWRKIISAIVVMLLPVLNNLWRVIPEDMAHAYYGSFQTFVWTFCIQFMLLLLGIAWYFSIPGKDHVLRFISLSVVGYGVLLTYQTFQFTEGTPLWLDILAAAVIFTFLYLCLRYIQRNYLEKPDDYKTLHDGLVYDLHHQRFLGSINRIAGLIDVAEMEKPYKQLCAEEIEELKESIAYIAEKYESLK